MPCSARFSCAAPSARIPKRRNIKLKRRAVKTTSKALVVYFLPFALINRPAPRRRHFEPAGWRTEFDANLPEHLRLVFSQ